MIMNVTVENLVLNRKPFTTTFSVVNLLCHTLKY